MRRLLALLAAVPFADAGSGGTVEAVGNHRAEGMEGTLTVD